MLLSVSFAVWFRIIEKFRSLNSEVFPLPVGTAFHDRTFALCHSLNYREWSGFYTVSSYEVHHEHEYNAIRNAAALIDITPLYKYIVEGKDATKLVNRVITRDINKVKPGQVIYCCWCDEQGKVIDDGTITRLEENKYRWTAADPSLRWFRQNGLNMDVQIEDVSEEIAALALQGPTSGKLLKSVAEADVANLKYFRMTSGKIAGVAVDISRTGYTGDLGYEIWVPMNDRGCTSTSRGRPGLEHMKEPGTSQNRTPARNSDRDGEVAPQRQHLAITLYKEWSDANPLRGARRGLRPLGVGRQCPEQLAAHPGGQLPAWDGPEHHQVGGGGFDVGEFRVNLPSSDSLRVQAGTEADTHAQAIAQ